MTHTPAPWSAKITHFGKDTIFFKIERKQELSYNKVICVSDMALPSYELEANANLIAAAPDMYEALKKISEIKALSYPDEHTIALAIHIAEMSIVKAGGK